MSKTKTSHELTADDVVNEDTLRAYYLQPFMFYIHANVVINLLTWYVDIQYGWRLWESEFNFARVGTLIIDLFWVYYFHRYLRTDGKKPPVQSDLQLIWLSIGAALIFLHYGEWLFELRSRTFHYSGILGLFNFLAGVYYTHVYLAKRIHWKDW